MDILPLDIRGYLVSTFPYSLLLTMTRVSKLYLQLTQKSKRLIRLRQSLIVPGNFHSLGMTQDEQPFRAFTKMTKNYAIVRQCATKQVYPLVYSLKDLNIPPREVQVYEDCRDGWCETIRDKDQIATTNGSAAYVDLDNSSPAAMVYKIYATIREGVKFVHKGHEWYQLFLDGKDTGYLIESPTDIYNDYPSLAKKVTDLEDDSAPLLLQVEGPPGSMRVKVHQFPGLERYGIMYAPLLPSSPSEGAILGIYASIT